MGPKRFVVLKIYHHLLIISGQVDSVETVETVELHGIDLAANDE